MIDKNNSNDNKDITDITLQTEPNVSESKATRFAMEYLNCHDVREAGRRAGYAESVLSSGYLYGKFKNPKFQEIFWSAAIALDYQDLAFVYSLERKALQEAVKQAKEKPESALENIAKLKQTSKQKKQIIGILGQDTPQPPQTINIALIERVQIAGAEMLRNRLENFKETTTK
jgi:hypothetical protein